MANDLFRCQLGVYASVHRDWRNKATHFVGIPTWAKATSRPGEQD